MKRIYAMEMESGIVKIGISQDVAQRMQQVAYARKEKVVNVHFTEFAPNAIARQIEQACHEAFADRRLFGEFFNVPFAEACAMLDSYEDEIEMANIDAAAAEVERLDEIEEFPVTKKASDGMTIGEAFKIMTVAESFKRFRKEFHLTQSQVAAALGVTQQAYQVYENKTIPTATVLIKIADAFNVSVDYLLGRTDEPKLTGATTAAIDKKLINALIVSNDALRSVLAEHGIDFEQLVEEASEQ